jgi:hypothetical protein
LILRECACEDLAANSERLEDVQDIDAAHGRAANTTAVGPFGRSRELLAVSDACAYW